MDHSRVFVFLIVTLFFSDGLCVSAYGDQSSAEEAARNAKHAMAEVLSSATNHSKVATSILRRMKSLKASAENAALKAESAANGHPEAESTAQQARIYSNRAASIYESAKDNALEAVNRMKTLLSQSEKLKKKYVLNIITYPSSNNNYAEIKKKATALINEANLLKTAINELVPLIANAQDAEKQMEKPVKDAQMKRYNVDMSIAVSKMYTMLNNADNSFRETDSKRSDVASTVQRIKALNKNIPEELLSYTDALCRNAEGDLRIAANAVDKAKKTREAMLELKTSRESAMKDIKTATPLEEIKQFSRTSTWYVEQMEKEVPAMVKALKSAATSVDNAKEREQEFINALAKSKEQPRPKNNKISTKTGQPNKNMTELQTSNVRDQQTKKEEEETVHKKSGARQTGLMVKHTVNYSEKTIIGAPEISVQQASDKPEIVNKEHLTSTNAVILNEAKQPKGAQNMAKIPLKGKNIPALGAWSDSAITVSVPLLVTLIVSFVLH